MSEARAHYDVLIALQSDGRDNANHHVYASDIWFGKIFSWYRVTV